MTYEYRCPNCGTVYTEKRSVAERDNAPICGTCGIRTKRKFPPSGVQLYCTYAFRYGSRDETCHLPTTEWEKQIWREYGGVENP